MKLLSVNVSLPREVAHGRRTVETGIFKEPVSGRVMLRKTNLDGDGQADLINHGGVHRAAYAYPIENYEYWRRELGRTGFGFGQFGENFTVEGMVEDDVSVGDIFRVGAATVEVSQPRSASRWACRGSPSCSWRADESGSTCASWRRARSGRGMCSSPSRETPGG